ncbi:hypothetical protein JCM10207_000904 [Rhodosporidiobolus poonsookiae]
MQQQQRGPPPPGPPQQGQVRQVVRGPPPQQGQPIIGQRGIPIQHQVMGGPGSVQQMPPPPPGMQRVGGPPGQGPPPGQVIGPSHPQHPQHGAWLAQQREMNGGGGPAYLPQPPPQHAHLPTPPRQPAYTSQPPPGQPGHAMALPQPPPNQLPQPPPQPQQGLPPPPGRALPPGVRVVSQNSLPQPPSSLPPPPAQNGAYTPSPQLQPANIARTGPPQALPPPAAVGLPAPPLPPQNAHPPRPVVRTASGVAPQHNALLAAHLAVHGTGPITATASPTGPALSRLAALNDALIQASEYERPLEALRQVISEHFTESGVVKVGLYDKAAQLSKVFEIPCSAWPRFQHLNVLLGVISTSLTPHFAREYRLTTPDPTASPSSPSSGGSAPPSLPVHIGYLLRADDASWTSRFSQGVKVELAGTLTVHLLFKDLGHGAAGLRIESLEFESRGHDEWISREVVEAHLAAAALPPEGFDPRASTSSTAAGKDDERPERPKPGRKGSATAAAAKDKEKDGGRGGMVTRRRSASARSEQLQLDEDEGSGSGDGEGDRKPSVGEKDEARRARARMPVSPVGTFGVTEMAMRCLEIAESVAQLQDLIGFSLDTNTGPIQSLARYADRHRALVSGQGTNPHSTPSGAGSLPLPPVPSTPSAQPIAASHQNPSTNSFYSSVTASPGPGPGSASHPPPPPGLRRQNTQPGGGALPVPGPVGAPRPGSAEGPLENGAPNGGAGGPGGKRTRGSAGVNGGAGSPPAVDGVDGGPEDAGSPQKTQKTASGRRRGR